MVDAREIADELTAAVASGDLEGATKCYAPQAVLVAPEGTFKGRSQIAEYFRSWTEPWSDTVFEVSTKASWGNRALDEWTCRATNSGIIALPTGASVPATGNRVTVRGTDICTVDEGAIVEHHIYYDQVELLGQLGLLPE
ncbi:MAG TPA: nuclear transport factor 2 family protein [Acidimicrobiales bacterium]|nr:nuclear transport factor 2 family protein [Acidimicrobiales bacterium]